MRIRILFILEKQKSIDLMEKVYAIIKDHRKLSMESSKMVNWMDQVNFILLVETIILGSSSLIKKMVVDFIDGLEKSQISTKENS